MAATFWFWFFTIVVSIIAGAILFILFYGLFTWLRDLLSLKRGIPKDKKSVTDYIKENPEKFEKTNPGRPLKENKQQELENERREQTKFREFEKLRRAELRGRASRERQPDSGSKGSEQLSGRNVLPNEPSTGGQFGSVGNAANRRKVRLDG